MVKIGFGGSCHWCTEAIFLSVKGVSKVSQGWINAEGNEAMPSEAVIVEFEPKLISLDVLIAIHLHTHSCTANHTMRHKYRSAIYTFNREQVNAASQAIANLQPQFDQPIITKVLPFREFKSNTAKYLNYYYSDPEKSFCQNIIDPKLKLLLLQFADQVDGEKLNWEQSRFLGSR